MTGVTQDIADKRMKKELDKKLFYTCPIEAAYMAKGFGVEFLVVWHGEETIVGWDNGDGASVFFGDNTDGPFYIHPDSLHIFEPEQGDWSIPCNIFTQGVWRNIYGGDSEPHEYKTDKRNGKAFIWPKEEE